MSYKTKKPFKKYLPKKIDKKLKFVILLTALLVVWILLINNWQVKSVSFAPIPIKKTITAYNVGIEAQTDDSPCIGAYNENLCKAIENGEKIIATNFLPKNTLVEIEGYGVFRVADRMNRRYTDRIDIAFGKNQLEEAKKFGVKKLNIKIIN